MLEPGEIQHLEKVAEWLGRPAWGVIVDEVRRQHGKRLINGKHQINWTKSLELLGPVIADEEPALESMIRAERIQQVRDAVASLPSRQRRVLALRLEGFSSKQIADDLGCGIDNVDFHTRNAKKSLREILAGDLL